MSALAALLYGLAVADLLRGGTPSAGRRRLPVAAVGGVLAVAVVGWLAGVDGWAGVLLFLVAAGTTAAWVPAADRGLRDQGWAALALAVPLTGATALVLASGWAPGVGGPFGRWLAWTGVPVLADARPQLALLVPALVLLQLATANVVVRLLLTQVGALGAPGVPQPADQLRGGRVLGPMERLFILGLGLAGEITAASVVIAAKGLIRWPELQSARRAHRARQSIIPAGADPERQLPTIDEITEYFLVGSFASWLVAMASVALTRLG